MVRPILPPRTRNHETRVCRELGTRREVVVLNDEAHHCYRHKPDAEEEALTGDDRREAGEREEKARVWVSGLDTARRLWVPAVNHDGRFGRWAFLEVRDPWEAKGAIRKLLATSQP